MEHISYITANFPQMCLMLDQFLWGHSSRVCDISCSFNFKQNIMLANSEDPEQTPHSESGSAFELVPH